MSATEQQPTPAAPPAEALPAPSVEATDAANTTATTATTATPDVPDAPEAPAAPAATEATVTTDAKEPAVESTPIAQLWALAKATGHPEIWGVTLADPEAHVPTRIILQKYLNANDADLAKAKDQLTKTLEWRAKTKPLELVTKAFSKAKFDGMGYVTKYLQEGSTEPESKEVFTWNIYGGVKSIDDTFGNLEEFLEWRVALMELALQQLDISSATKPITADDDPYKMFQVHDYKSISFLRQSPHVKSASAETIKVFAQNYPELLKEKFFVNVPAIMGFVYTFMKLFVAAKTIKKFHPMSNGGNLAVEFGESKVSALGEKLPANYGGKGSELGEQGKGPVLE
ncbi:CRAL-TRIO domain-containing protein [Chaetomidium leptoderma]|uniref:Phosphatidylinositol transfer protein SFH5 n=1 Tax=Chaetomidium leptoderma TaxID=669021 RepID=A0AAN6ZTF5_9PEZI|nr:CRAL-TRIO domain-containing protein [Chaetomidium leptoderma]